MHYRKEHRLSGGFAIGIGGRLWIVIGGGFAIVLCG